MPSTYSTNLNLELQATGENAGTWGAMLNSNDFQIIDQAMGGLQTLSLSNANITVTTSQSQNNFLILTGVLTANVSVIFPAIGRTYQVMNATTGAFTVTAQIGSPAAGATTGIPQGATQTIVLDGTNVYLVASGRVSGEIATFAFNAVPPGWLECDGSAISRTSYPALNNLAAIASYGAPWGAGDGSTTFNIPDLRGYFLRGWDHGAGRDSGRSFGSTQTSQNLAHTHTATVTDPGHEHGASLYGGQGANISGRFSNWATEGSADSTGTTNSSKTGIMVSNASNGGSEARPINVALLFAIKT